MNHRPLYTRGRPAAGLPTCESPSILNMVGSPAACVGGDNHRTSPTEPLKIRPDRPDQHFVHPGVNLSAALLAAGCDYIEIQAHSSLHNHNASRILPENCNVHGGCFHFMSLESIFHSFLSLRHMKTEEMTTIWDILVSPLSPIFNFHHRRHE